MILFDIDIISNKVYNLLWFSMSGSACTSGSLDPSYVLLSMGLTDELASGALRISIGKYNTKQEIDYLVENLVEIVHRLRKIKSNEG